MQEAFGGSPYKTYDLLRSRIPYLAIKAAQRAFIELLGGMIEKR